MNQYVCEYNQFKTPFPPLKILYKSRNGYESRKPASRTHGGKGGYSDFVNYHSKRNSRLLNTDILYKKSSQEIYPLET